MVRSPSAASKPPCAAFQSHPTDLELVNSYLRPWVETGLKAGPFIHEADVYAADPADLTRRFEPAVAQDGERAWYFFTPLRHKSVRGKRKARTVASGGRCWHNEAKSKPVFTGINGRRQIGHRQSFSFVKKDDGARIRTGWLMMELRLLKDGAAGKGAQGEGALGNLVLCKVYRSPRNPEPGDRDPAPATATAALIEEAAVAADGDGDGSSAATADDDDSSSDAPQATPAAAAAASSVATKKSDEEDSSEATVAAPSRHSKADGEIPGAAAAAAAPGRKEKAAGDEDSAETSAAAPPARKRKAPDDESSGAAAAAPAPKRSCSFPGAPAPPSTELQCPHCGTHLVVTLKRPETKSETEIEKDVPAPGASDAPPARGEAGGSEKNPQFHHFL